MVEKGLDGLRFGSQIIDFQGHFFLNYLNLPKPFSTHLNPFSLTLLFEKKQAAGYFAPG